MSASGGGDGGGGGVQNEPPAAGRHFSRASVFFQQHEWHTLFVGVLQLATRSLARRLMLKLIGQVFGASALKAPNGRPMAPLPSEGLGARQTGAAQRSRQPPLSFKLMAAAGARRRPREMTINSFCRRLLSINQSPRIGAPNRDKSAAAAATNGFRHTQAPNGPLRPLWPSLRARGAPSAGRPSDWRPAARETRWPPPVDGANGGAARSPLGRLN